MEPTTRPISRSRPELGITGAELTRHRTQVLLTTLPQTAGEEYTVDVRGVADLAGNEIVPDSGSAVLTGTARELFLYSAVALSNTTVLVTFSEPVDPHRAVRHSLYAIEDPDGQRDVDIAILNAEMDEIDPRAVVLTTTSQENITYTLHVTNIRAAADEFLIDPARSHGVFYGIGPEDTDGPRLLRAASTSSSTVLLSFSEPLDDDAADPVNFIIRCETCDSDTLVIFDAWLTAHNTQIVLATLPQTAGKQYHGHRLQCER